jgi:hypothetical protein
MLSKLLMIIVQVIHKVVHRLGAIISVTDILVSVRFHLMFGSQASDICYFALSSMYLHLFTSLFQCQVIFLHMHYAVYSE